MRSVRNKETNASPKAHNHNPCPIAGVSPSAAQTRREVSIRRASAMRLAILLLPRLLLFRPARGGNIHKGKLAQRFQDFSEGRWSEWLRVSTQSAEDASKAQSRKRRHRIVEQELDRRAARALSLVQMGELSSGRQALQGASLAPGTRQTLEALRDPIRRPPHSGGVHARRDVLVQIRSELEVIQARGNSCCRA